jgi:hypothetical protein
LAGRSRTTFTKLQKERARREKQQEKAARKQQRKLDNATRDPNEIAEFQPSLTVDDEGSELPADVDH